LTKVTSATDPVWATTADGAAVVYVSGSGDIVAKPAEGGSPATLVAIDDAASVRRIELISDGSAIVYAVRVADEAQLWVQPLSAGPVVAADGTPVQLGVTDVDSFAIAPDGLTVVAVGQVDGALGLFASPTMGGTPLRLDAASKVVEFHIAPSGQWLAYRTSPGQLFGVGLDATAHTELSPRLVDGGKVRAGFAVTNEAAVFRADARIDGKVELFAATFASQDVRRLSRKIVAGGDVKRLTVSPDGATVVFAADAIVNNEVELFSVGVTTGRPVAISGSLTSGGDVRGDFTITPDSSTVVFRADAVTNNTYELFAVPIGSGDRTKISAVLTAGGDVSSRFVLSANPSHVLYVADAIQDGRRDLFSAPLSGGTTVRLNNGSSPKHDVQANFGHPPSDFVPFWTTFGPNGSRWRLASVEIGIRCGGGFATMVGTSGADRLIGTPGPDVIVGNGGDDIIRGNGGDDIICGGAGTDYINGGKGADKLLGDGGGDTLLGGRGADTLIGGSGRDMLRGGSGPDSCVGGSGADTQRSCDA
jgi:Ca2+-binding RTX toxin-like protein